MERLALCSRILYNEDLLNKKKEIEKLKESIIKKPKLIFKNENEWIKRRDLLFNILEENIMEIIVEDDYLYNEIENIKYYSNDICSGQRYMIYTLLFKELNILTGEEYQRWCEYISWELVFSLDSGIQTLKIVDKIDDFSDYELAEFICKNIFWQLDEGKRLEDIICYDDNISNNDPFLFKNDPILFNNDPFLFFSNKALGKL
jgi:hypothetical protein